MKYIYTLFFLLGLIICKGQSGGVCITKHPDKPVDRIDLTTKLQTAKNSLIECDTSACTSTKLHYMASLYYALDYPMDTVELYLNKAQKANPIYFCRLVKMIHNDFQKEVFKKDKLKYFASDFSKEWWMEFTENCKKIKVDSSQLSKTRKLEEILNPNYLADLKKLMDLDQKYRTDLDSFFLQATVDLQNRISLDSLYDLYGFPNQKQTGKKGSEIAWFILHHSTDCDWNKKWIMRFLNVYQSGQTRIHFLNKTIERFYHPEKGFCSKKDKESAQAFILLLKKKYPKEYAKRFGYKEF